MATQGQDLPSTSTPITSANLIKDQTSIGSTKPTHGENVWFKTSKNLINPYADVVFVNNAYKTPLSTGLRVTSKDTYEYNYIIIDLGALSNYEGNTLYLKATNTNSTTANKGRIYIGKANSDYTARAIISDSTAKASGSFSISGVVPAADSTYTRLILVIYCSSGTNVTAGSYVDYTNLIASWENISYVSYVDKEIYTSNTNGVYDIFELKSNEIFSSEEKLIGTWVNGKPLYRKSIFLTLPSGTTDVAVANNLQLCMLQIGYFNAPSGGNNRMFPFPFINDAGLRVTGWGLPSSGAYHVINEISAYNGSNCNLEIIYTKTTD